MRKPIPRCSSRRFSCGDFVWMALTPMMALTPKRLFLSLSLHVYLSSPPLYFFLALTIHRFVERQKHTIRRHVDQSSPTPVWTAHQDYDPNHWKPVAAEVWCSRRPTTQGRTTPCRRSPSEQGPQRSWTASARRQGVHATDRQVTRVGMWSRAECQRSKLWGGQQRTDFPTEQTVPPTRLNRANRRWTEATRCPANASQDSVQNSSSQQEQRNTDKHARRFGTEWQRVTGSTV